MNSVTRLLALDIGNRRTGVAFAEVKAGFVMALDTLRHASEESLLDQVGSLVKQRGITELIIGLPRLPQGGEGSQAGKIRMLAAQLETELSLKVTLVDERYTSMTREKGIDPDAQAACALLSVVLDQRKREEEKIQ
ncbi:MAG: Holliday junction resolvase RuvX [Candidatus Peribacteraceae bacterium]|nr:Holliday junction resolvase RuvX [Candidatus Peribacteraceae bacterium]